MNDKNACSITPASREVIGDGSSLERIADRIAKDIFKCGDEPSSPCKRIQYKGGELPDRERDQGGSCFDSLKSIIFTSLKNQLVGQPACVNQQLLEAAVIARDELAATAMSGTHAFDHGNLAVHRACDKKVDEIHALLDTAIKRVKAEQ